MNTNLDHQIRIIRQILRQRLAPIRMSPPLHERDRARPRLAQVLLRPYTPPREDSVGASDDLGRRKGGVQHVVVVVEDERYGELLAYWEEIFGGVADLVGRSF